MDTSKNNCLALGFSEEFHRVITADKAPEKNKYLLLLINEENACKIPIGFAATVVCPDKISVTGVLRCENIITCGMSARSTLSFSSVGEDTAVLSVSRKVGNLSPCETVVTINKKMSLYENLVINAVRLLNI